MHLQDVAQVDYICRISVGDLPRRAGPRAYYSGCYNPRLDVVVMVRPEAWPSRREWEETRAHEWAHARGWRHQDDGRGTDWAVSLPPHGAAAFAATDAAQPASATAQTNEDR